MRLWSYQPKTTVVTLQQGVRHTCSWQWVQGERWQAAYQLMVPQMEQCQIPIGDNAHVWAWHSVKRYGGKPDELCALMLLSELELEAGIDLIELNVPDALVLLSSYPHWNEILFAILGREEPPAEAIEKCFKVETSPRKGRPPYYYPEIQACLPYIEPNWLVGWEVLDTEEILRLRS